MKRIILFLALALISIGSSAQNKDTKTLVAYFSATGTTEAVAKDLAEVTGADLYEISPVQAYSSADLDWRNKQSRSSVEMSNPASRPAFVKNLKNADKYDVIYLGYPIWWNTAPTIINTFVEAYGFEGKKVIMFATSGGSTIEKALSDFKAAYPKIKWGEAKLLNGATKESLKTWTSVNQQMKAPSKEFR